VFSLYAKAGCVLYHDVVDALFHDTDQAALDARFQEVRGLLQGPGALAALGALRAAILSAIGVSDPAQFVKLLEAAGISTGRPNAVRWLGHCGRDRRYAHTRTHTTAHHQPSPKRVDRFGVKVIRGASGNVSVRLAGRFRPHRAIQCYSAFGRWKRWGCHAAKSHSSRHKSTLVVRTDGTAKGGCGSGESGNALLNQLADQPAGTIDPDLDQFPKDLRSPAANDLTLLSSCWTRRRKGRVQQAHSNYSVCSTKYFVERICGRLSSRTPNFAAFNQPVESGILADPALAKPTVAPCKARRLLSVAVGASSVVGRALTARQDAGLQLFWRSSNELILMNTCGGSLNH